MHMMGRRISVVVMVVLMAATTVMSDDMVPIPPVKADVKKWFNQNVKPLQQRTSTLDKELIAAELGPHRIIKVSQDGKGDFKTINQAIGSILPGNSKRVIVHIGPGVYKEKVTIERTKGFVTLYGDPKNRPNITFNGTAKQFGTVDSATIIAEGPYFVAANLIISNSAPMPDGRAEGAQAVALRLSGDKSVLYNCVLLGYQDTLCDDRGNHLFKDCTIQGTVDFIFGSGKSIYLNTKLIVLGSMGGIITAQARKSEEENIGYSFVHCDVSGVAQGTWLGRAWMSHGKVVFAYSNLSKIINPLGWSENKHPGHAKTVYFGEYKNSGEGANLAGRAPFTKKLTDAEAKTFLTLGFIEGSKWLLPPPTL